MARGFFSDQPRKSDLVDLAGTLRHETERGLLIDFGDGKPVWLPKSQVQDNRDGTFAMPEWLAKDKGIL